MKALDFIKQHKLAIILIIGVTLIAVAVGVGIAQYWMVSNDVSGTVEPTPTPPPQATVSLNIDGGSTSTITYGGNFILTATVSDGSDGLLVAFYEGTAGSGTQIGTAITTGGVATFTVMNPTVGTHTYHARCQHP